MNDQMVLEELKILVDMGNRLRRLHDYLPDDPNGFQSMEDYHQTAKKWELSATNLLELRFGLDSDFTFKFLGIFSAIKERAIRYSQDNIISGTAILEATYNALQKGLTNDLFYREELIIFGDLLDQAFEFLNKGFKPASAIYGRIVLEITIKEYAKKYKIDINGLSFEDIIVKLRKNSIINQIFEGNLRTNYKIGTLATHNYKEFKDLSNEEIKDYLSFIREKVLTLK